MTAEVIVMNTLAIAAAADSAVTVGVAGGQKIYQSANKLFALSKNVPVGLMVYGSAEFMQVPWETVIKTYRTHLGKARFAHLADYCTHFFDFLQASRNLFPDEAQKIYVRRDATAHLLLLGASLKEAINAQLKGAEDIPATRVRRLIARHLAAKLRELRAMPAPDSLPTTYPSIIRSTYGPDTAAAIKDAFANVPLTRKASQTLVEILAEALYRRVLSEDSVSGVVIMGLGDEDVFPQAIEHIVRGIAADILWKHPHRTGDVTRENTATIIPFAQSEMVNTFMEGIDPNLGKFMMGMFRRLLRAYVDEVAEALPATAEEARGTFRKQIRAVCDQQLEELQEGLDRYRTERHVDPIMSMIAALPKDELARVAEALVNLTSFKRRVTAEAETVAGPIDVAVISRGDGFVWIRRKHYFPAELNPEWSRRAMET